MNDLLRTSSGATNETSVPIIRITLRFQLSAAKEKEAFNKRRKYQKKCENAPQLAASSRRAPAQPGPAAWLLLAGSTAARWRPRKALQPGTERAVWVGVREEAGRRGQ